MQPGWPPPTRPQGNDERDSTVTGSSSPLVSVVVTSYNVQAYLPACLDSLLAQTEPNFEAIVVDDASTDGSFDIIREVASRDPRVKPIRRQENAGPSVARNMALDQAAGLWVFFLDGDDFLSPNALEILLHAALEDESDIVRGMHYFYYEPRLEVNQFEEWNQIEVRGIRFEQCPHSVFYWASSNTLFRRSFLEEHGLRFEPSLSRGEDRVFNLMCFSYPGTLTLLKRYTYFWRKNRAIGEHLSTVRLRSFTDVLFTCEYTLRVANERARLSRQQRQWLMTYLYFEIVNHLIISGPPWETHPDEFRQRVTLLLEQLDVTRESISLPFIKGRMARRVERYERFFDAFYLDHDMDAAVASARNKRSGQRRPLSISRWVR